MKRSYIEPKDAPSGVPCRFCDMPAGADGLGPVYVDGTAVDGKRPLFSHGYCLMNSGGKKQDNYDFSLQDLLPNNLKSTNSNDSDDYASQMGVTASAEEDDIWAFASKNRFIATKENNFLTHIKKHPKVEKATRVDKSEEYDDDDTGAPNPPSK